eukprot:5078620-Prorocentrum_lima.AAC.1
MTSSLVGSEMCIRDRPIHRHNLRRYGLKWLFRPKVPDITQSAWSSQTMTLSEYSSTELPHREICREAASGSAYKGA